MKYNQAVKITSGFYEGLTGTLYAVSTTWASGPTGMDEVINNYTVLINGGHKIIVKPLDLEEVDG